MIQGSSKPGAGALSQSGPHDEFLELCAASTSGELTDDEQKRLREHLAVCASCREALRQYDWPPASRETIVARGTLDFDRLRWPIILRNWRPGDSYRPCGRKRARKLKRMFLEARVPRSTRASWPVLTSGGKLVWASGYPVADEFAARPGTHTGLVIAEEDL